MQFPEECRFHPEHMWVRRDGDIGIIGVSAFAQQALGDVNLVSVPDPGTRISHGVVFGAIESVKVASDLFAPVSGEIIEINPKLADEPWLVNDAPYEAGWIARVRLSEPAEIDALLTAAAYSARVS
jgi:glycine cleavage system H protein